MFPLNLSVPDQISLKIKDQIIYLRVDHEIVRERALIAEGDEDVVLFEETAQRRHLNESIIDNPLQ